MVPTIYLVKRQKKRWACGAAVVRNVFRVFGLRVAEHEIRGCAGSSQAFGTSESGILDALRAWGFRPLEHSFDCRQKALEWLHETLAAGQPVILAVENWEHWVLAMGSLGPSGIAIFDSSNFKVNVYENGAHVWPTKKLMHMWWNDRKSIGTKEKRIYAISVRR